MKLQEILDAVKAPDAGAMKMAKARWDSIAKPLCSLGLMEEAVIRMAGMTGSADVRLDRRCLVVMCADNGVIAEGVTQSGSDVTAIVTQNFTKGATSACAMARAARCDVFPIDIGVATAMDCQGLISHKIGFGTRNMTREPAMTREQAMDALTFGANFVLRLKELGYRIIATGEMGIGNTTSSSAVCSVLLGVSPEAVTGRGAGLSDEGLDRKVDAIHRAIRLNRPDPADGVDVLAKVGGFDLAGLAGIFLGGAAFGVPVVIDGFISAAAALAACRICPAARDYWLAAHVSKEPAAKLVLEALKLRPMITADLCLGEGTGAVSMLPLLDMGLAVYHEMSTFQDVNIENYVPLGGESAAGQGC